MTLVLEKTYKKGYTGPDLLNYTYIEAPEKVHDVIEVDNTITVKIVDVPDEWKNFNKYDDTDKKFEWPEDGIDWKDLTFLAKKEITINLDAHGFPKSQVIGRGSAFLLVNCSEQCLR